MIKNPDYISHDEEKLIKLTKPDGEGNYFIRALGDNAVIRSQSKVQLGMIREEEENKARKVFLKKPISNNRFSLNCFAHEKEVSLVIESIRLKAKNSNLVEVIGVGEKLIVLELLQKPENVDKEDNFELMPTLFEAIRKSKLSEVLFVMANAIDDYLALINNGLLPIDITDSNILTDGQKHKIIDYGSIIFLSDRNFVETNEENQTSYVVGINRSNTEYTIRGTREYTNYELIKACLKSDSIYENLIIFAYAKILEELLIKKQQLRSDYYRSEIIEIIQGSHYKKQKRKIQFEPLNHSLNFIMKDLFKLYERCANTWNKVVGCNSVIDIFALKEALLELSEKAKKIEKEEFDCF